jgi:hypothetical protein
MKLSPKGGLVDIAGIGYNSSSYFFERINL